jgi:hypothetical protein
MNERYRRALAIASMASLGTMASPILTEAPAAEPGPTESRVRAILEPRSGRKSQSLSRLLKKARGR